MRTFSRWMPRSRLSRASIAVLIGLAGGAAVLVRRHSWLLIPAAAVLAISHVLDRRRRARLQAWAGEREGEGLCTFVRAFPRDQRDGWVLRAVYVELQPYYRIDRRVVAPRPGDLLREELKMDPEDIEFIVLASVKRAGRESGNWKTNPYRDHVLSVADLVALVGAQPRVPA